MFKLVLALVACMTWSVTMANLGPLDTARLQQVLLPAWELNDLPTLMFAASSYKHLDLKVPDSKAACAYVSEVTSGSPTTEMIFQASATAEYLGCPLKPSAQMKQTVAASLSEGIAMSELYHAALSSSRLGLALDSPKVLALTQAALKRDDGVLSLGYSFHIGSVLSGNTSPLVSRVEDAVVQADEVDGHMLQFEGGLSITALLVDGMYRLCEKAGKPVPLKPEQAVKFSTYLLSRKSVRVAKSVHYLLHALTTLTNNKFHLPVSMSVQGGAAVSSGSPLLSVVLSDVLGGAVKGEVALVADSVGLDGELGKALPFKAGPGGVFTLDVMALAPSRGFQQVTVSAVGGDKRLVGQKAVVLRFKVLSSISVEGVSFGTADIDGAADPLMQKVTYANTLPSAVSADKHQKLVLRFSVKDTSTSASTQVHQAFVRIHSASTGAEHIFVAEEHARGYSFEMGVAKHTVQFNGASGVYGVELILGDSCISNPLRWALAEVKLEFPDTFEPKIKAPLFKTALPEISHTFALPDPRPSSYVSLLFTGLCAAPILLLFVLWGKLGVNLSNFPLSLKALGFHAGLGATLAVFGLFWLRLDMFTTLRYLAIIALPTFYCGNATLSAIAAKRMAAGK